MPIPPPPPPRRPPTPLASRGLGESDFDDGLGSVAPSATDEPAEDTGSVGLFANSRSLDDESSRRPAAARPGVPAAPVAAAPSFGSASAAPAMTTDVGGHATGFEALLGDAAVTQILITAPDAALVDRGSGLGLHDGSLGEPNAVADALWRLANTAFPPPAPDNPVVDVRLADGTRVSAAFPPASPTGVVAAIRRPVLLARTLSDLIPAGSKDAQTLLESGMSARRNLLLTGDAAAMPQLLGALAAAIPADRRVVAIGAAQPQVRGGWTDLAPAADMAGLLRVASTLRADHLMVGEVMGPEARRARRGAPRAFDRRYARPAGGAGGGGPGRDHRGHDLALRQRVRSGGARGGPDRRDGAHRGGRRAARRRGVAGGRLGHGLHR